MLAGVRPSYPPPSRSASPHTEARCARLNTGTQLESRVPELVGLGEEVWRLRFLARSQRPRPGPASSTRRPLHSDGDGGSGAPAEDHVTRLAIGGVGSGVYFHSHGLALNAVFHGRKRWWIESASQPASRGRAPPTRSESSVVLNEVGAALDAAMPMARWVTDVWDARADLVERWQRDGFECVQLRGELMYVPSKLRHAVVNQELTLAMAMAMDTHV